MAAQIIAFITNILIGFFLTPFIIKHIGREAYGFVGLAGNFIGYAAIITTALNSMAGRFITISIHREQYNEANQYFTSVLISNIVISVPVTIASVFLLLFLDKIVNVPTNILSDVKFLWGLLFANFIITLVGNVFNVATFARNRLDLSSLRSIESSFIRIAILVTAYVFFKPSVWYLGLASLIQGVFVLCSNAYYTKKLLPDIKISKKHFDFSKIKELISSGMWNSLSSLSSTLSSGLDLLITNLFVGAAAMGTVSLSKTLPGYILSAFGMLSSVFAPQLTISYAKNDFKDIKNQLNSSMRLLGFFACIPLAFLFAYGKDFFMLWVPEQDAQLLWILSILCSAAMPLSMPLEPLWSVFTVTNKVRTSSTFLIINSFLTIIVVFILLKFAPSDTSKMYIVMGVSTIFSIIRALTFLPIFGARCLNFKWNTFYPNIFKNLLTCAVGVVAGGLIKKIIIINSWIDLFMAVILMCIAVCIINFFLLLKKSERKILVDKIFRRSRI